MNNHRPTQRLFSLLVATVILASPLIAQQRRNAAAKKPAPPAPAEPAPAFDTLLAADSYKIYCEVRGVGGLIRSSAVNDLLDPVMKLGGPNREFKSIVRWLNDHADVLAGSRMLIAGWSSRPKLPNFLVAIEFSSAEEAKKFYPELRGFIPTLYATPTPTPSSTPSPSPAATPISLPGPVATVPAARTEQSTVRAELVVVSLTPPQNIGTVAQAQPAPTPPPFQMKQTGNLVLLSDTAFNFSDLRPRGAKPLEEEQNFVLARNRFASESVFLYVDVKTIEKEEKDRQKKYEEEEQKRIEAEIANPPKPEELQTEETAITPPPVEEQPSPPTEPEPEIPEKPTPEVTGTDPPAPSTGTLSAGPARGPDPMDTAFYSLYGALFGGESKWPEAVAAALAFESDAYVVRTLIINDADTKPTAIPFAPQFVSGPALVPASPNIFPADTDLFVSVSLDYVQVYEGMIKAIAQAEERSRKYARRYRRDPGNEDPAPESPFAIYEKKLGLKIKDDILPLLGNELALALPKKPPTATASPAGPGAKKATPADSAQPDAKPPEPSPVIAISIRDREAVGRLIPKIIESLGFKGANLFAQTEKRDGTEFVSYAGVFAYAFVGDFLVVGADAAATRRVVDAYLDHQTLSSDSHFRNFTRWQPHQVLGQVYVAPGLVEQYNPIFGSRGRVNDKMSEVLSQVNPVIDPLTYALSNDGQGPLHELHIPKNLLLLMVAGVAGETGQPPLEANEAGAQSMLRTVAAAEATFQATVGDGRYGTLDELASNNLISKDYFKRFGYNIEITASGSRFEATAVPLEYGKSGKLSYFIDESGVLRAGDHGGGAATIADQPPE